MRVLFIRPQVQFYESASDYQIDMLFHGLRTLLGVNCIDVDKMWHMYDNIDMSKKSYIWGKGFTLYGLLPDIDIDRNNIIERAKSGEFDVCIYGIHHTLVQQPELVTSHIQALSEIFPKNRLFVIDGHDRPWYNEEVAAKSTYFKREMYENTRDILPIHFAIPAEKIGKIQDPKIHHFAPLVPVNHSWNSEHIKTYIYNDEESYRKDYAQSWFAYTCKKGGWDCLRHYEILANGCIPWFTDIEKCPPNTLFRFPKDLCIKAKKIKGCIPGTTEPYNPNEETYLGTTEKIKLGKDRGSIAENFDFGLYYDILEEMRYILRRDLTTEALSQYVLEQVC